MDKWKMSIQNSTNGHLKVSWVLPENGIRFVPAMAFQLKYDQ